VIVNSDELRQRIAVLDPERLAELLRLISRLQAASEQPLLDHSLTIRRQPPDAFSENA
jgi:hypothetical protein